MCLILQGKGRHASSRRSHEHHSRPHRSSHPLSRDGHLLLRRLQLRPGPPLRLLRRRHDGRCRRVRLPLQRPALHRPGDGARRPLRHLGALPAHGPVRHALRLQRDDDQPGHVPPRRERAGAGHGAHRPCARRHGAAALPPARVGGGARALRRRAGGVRRHVVPSVHAAAARRRGVRVPEGHGALHAQRGHRRAGRRAVRAQQPEPRRAAGALLGVPDGAAAARRGRQEDVQDHRAGRAEDTKEPRWVVAS